jgi:hypothetical protein
MAPANGAPTIQGKKRAVANKGLGPGRVRVKSRKEITMPGRRPKGAAWRPCVICGDFNGDANRRCSVPARMSLKRFGLEGEACLRCYARIKRREGRGTPLDPERLKRHPAAIKPRKGPGKSSWPPCAICGDPDGGKAKNLLTPSRHNLRRFGVDGVGCQRCYVRLKDRARTGLVADPFAILPPGRRRRSTTLA